jgi:hypothetical protein
VFLLLLCNDPEVLGPWRNPGWLNVLASVIVAVLVLLSLILMATTVFPTVNVIAVALARGSRPGCRTARLRSGDRALTARQRAGDDYRERADDSQKAVDDAAVGAAGPAGMVNRAQDRDAGLARVTRRV